MCYLEKPKYLYIFYCSLLELLSNYQGSSLSVKTHNQYVDSENSFSCSLVNFTTLAEQVFSRLVYFLRGTALIVIKMKQGKKQRLTAAIHFYIFDYKRTIEEFDAHLAILLTKYKKLAALRVALSKSGFSSHSS